MGWMNDQKIGDEECWRDKRSWDVLDLRNWSMHEEDVECIADGLGKGIEIAMEDIEDVVEVDA